MHSTFAVYLRLGFGHIADWGALDHILFVVVLAAGYAPAAWRRLLVLVTAFTAGHSITLALATLRLVSIGSGLVEILIPITILATGAFNVLEARTSRDAPERPGRQRHVKYGMALCFGLVHGLGFSTVLRALLGDEESIALPLFSFNVGLELGQLAVLAAVLLLTWTTVRRGRMRQRAWTVIVSSVASLAALLFLAGRVPH